MSTVLDRSELEQSPLADLHLMANELGVDGYRRLRKGGPDRRDRREAVRRRPGRAGADEAEPTPRDRARGRGAEAAEVVEPEAADATTTRARASRAVAAAAAVAVAAPAPRRARPTRTRASPSRPSRAGAEHDRVAEGVVELLGNGSGFIRLAPPETTDDDVYVSAAQVKRCELVSGDRVAGPVRAPRRSERFPSLIRVDTINGRPADEVAEGTRFDDLPVALPGRALRARRRRPDREGDRVADAVRQGLARRHRRRRRAPARPRRCAGSRARSRRRGRRASRSCSPACAPRRSPSGAARSSRPPRCPSPRSADAQAQAVEQAVEQGRRVAARGGDAVVLIDTLEHLPAHARTAGAGGGAQHRRRRLADGRRDRARAARRRDDGRRARRRAHRQRPVPGARPRRERHAAAGAARGRRAPRRSPRRARRSRADAPIDVAYYTVSVQ